MCFLKDLSIFPKIKVAHLELGVSYASPPSKDGNKVYLYNHGSEYIFSTFPSGDVTALCSCTYEGKLAPFSISLDSKIFDSAFHKLGPMKSVYLSQNSIIISFHLERFESLFCDAAMAFTNSDTNDLIFSCRWCSQVINKTSLKMEHMPSESWRNMVDCWSCHSSEFASLAAHAIHPKSGTVLASRESYRFNLADVSTPCVHISYDYNESEATISKLDTSMHSDLKRDENTEKNSVELALSSILMDIIFYESVYMFKIASSTSSLCFRADNCSMFKLCKRPPNSFLLLDVISISITSSNAKSQVTIDVSDEAFQEIQKIISSKNYLIKQSVIFYLMDAWLLNKRTTGLYLSI